VFSENGHWKEDAISWDFAQGGYPNPRSRGKTQEEGASSSGAGPEEKESQKDKGAAAFSRAYRSVKPCL